MTVIAVNKPTDIFPETIGIKVLNKEYVDIIKCLEKTYLANCQDAAVAEESSEIKIIVDKAENFAKSHQYYQLYNSVIEAFDKIQSFRQSRQDSGYCLPDDINNRLKEYIGIHQRSIKTIIDSCMSWQDIVSYTENSQTRDLKKWAEALEKFGDAFEDNIEFFSVDFLERFQPAFWNIIEKSQKKSSELKTRRNAKESYRIRIRNAAGFMSNLIDHVIEESNAEEREISASIQASSQLVFCDN
jgi:hypothetical protein